MKTCNTCEQEKPEDDFPRYPNGKTRPRCKTCSNAAVREWMANGPKGRPSSPKQPIQLEDPAAVWATRRMA